MTSLGNSSVPEARFGISEPSFRHIQRVLSEFCDVDRVVIFGSRAKGNHRKGSDIDLAVYGAKLRPETAGQLETELNERVPIPYYVDVVAPQYSSHDGLIDHINRVGKVFYRKC